jgi:hypothetical protein
MKDVEQFLNIGFPSKIYVKLNRIIHAILFVKINMEAQLAKPAIIGRMCPYF